jgi:hypothetical protein
MHSNSQWQVSFLVDTYLFSDDLWAKAGRNNFQLWIKLSLADTLLKGCYI